RNGVGYDAQTTTYEYDLQADGSSTTTITLPDLATQTEKYGAGGELLEREGDRTYKMKYTYDYAGRMETLSTWRDADLGSPTLTQWEYNARGQVAKKYYDYQAE